jgi:hypothetical protein
MGEINTKHSVRSGMRLPFFTRKNFFSLRRHNGIVAVCNAILNTKTSESAAATTTRTPFEIYNSGADVYIHKGDLDIIAPQLNRPIQDFENFQTPSGTDDPDFAGGARHFTVANGVSLYEIYYTASIPSAVNPYPDRFGFVAVPDGDYTATILIADGTVFNWSAMDGLHFNYAVRLGQVICDGAGAVTEIEQHDPLPPLHMVGNYPMHFRGAFDNAARYICGAVVLTSDSDFDYQWILDVAEPGLAYSPSEGPVVGVVPSTASSYPWRLLSKSPKVGAAYFNGAYDATKLYLRKA